MTDTLAPGSRTVNADATVDLAARLGEYFTLTPVKLGLAPLSVVMLKVLAGRVLRTVRGSLRSLRVSSPVLVTVATTFKFSTPSTAAGPVTLRDRPGAAETEAAVAMATRAMRVARREVENMALRKGGRT